MIILALDLSSRTGWAVGHIQDGPQWGCFVLPKTGENLGPFLQAFDDWLDTRLHRNRPDLVAYEAPVFYKPGTTQLVTIRKLYSLASVTELVCHRHGIDVTEADNQQVKKFFTNHGGKKGARMILAARDRGFVTSDDNEADALGIWLYMVALLDKANGTSFAMKYDPLLRSAA